MPETGHSQHPQLIFDGDCGFCTRCVLWLEHRRVAPLVSIPWQNADLEALGLTEEQTREAVWWVSEEERARGHRAVARSLQGCRRPWPLLGALLLLPPPFAWFYAAGYRLVTHLRGYLPGTTPACRRPSWPPEQARKN
ncbi:MAG: DCC1-like thiol-disulfide oxidoreductase family protein [Acidobacteriota bacterium]|nr:DCC1-like thiol-disulfide oxidoreductase family protein [Acidobacteriota bacterium]